MNAERLPNQLIGAYGEKAVEAELLRRGWRTANINTSIKNSKDFDIVAYKESLTVKLRVKTCRPRAYSFAFNWRKAKEIETKGLKRDDFTVLAAMGQERGDDVFYVVPTQVIRRALERHRTAYLKKVNQDGTQRKDMGRWDLRLHEQKTNPDGSGFEKKWKRYRENWKILETKLSSA